VRKQLASSGFYLDIDAVSYASIASGGIKVDADAAGADAVLDSNGLKVDAQNPVKPDAVISGSGFSGTVSDVYTDDASWMVGS